MRAKNFRSVVCIAVFFTAALSLSAGTNEAEIIEVRKIWDAAPHNAFTDLIRFDNQWFCVFREGAKHVAPNGALRIITSPDGANWTSAALISSTNGDLRDAKITVTPDNRLILSGAIALHQPAKFKHQSLSWFSKDGKQWGESTIIGDPNMWLWRTTWHNDTAYCMAYETTGARFVRFYSSKDGKKYRTVVENAFHDGGPSEASLLFLKDDTCLCLLRRDNEKPSGQLGISLPPYKDWEWKDLGVKIGGQHLISLPDGRIVVATRLYDGGAHTSLAWLDPADAKLTEFLKLPSGGDNSYPGLVWHNGLLWVSYYSSHEGKTSIYLAKVKLPATN